MSDPVARAADPSTHQDELAVLAYEHPELGALIARNPSAYPELLDWLATHGDQAAQDAVAARVKGGSIEPPPLDPTPAPRRVWPLLVGLAALVVLAIIGTAIAVIVIRGSAGEPPAAVPTQSSTPTPTPSALPPSVTVADLRQLPIVAVTVATDTGPTPNSVQRFANDVAEGDTESLLSKCWTFAPATIRDRYASDAARGGILDALAHVGETGQSGTVWHGDLIEVVFSPYELKSTYACPVVLVTGVDESYSTVDAAYFVHRLAGRLTGAPVAALDTEANYPLACDDGPEGWMFAADGVTPPNMLDPGPVNAAVLALDGHPLSVAPLGGQGTADYFEISSSEVASSIVVRRSGWWICVGEAR